MRHAFSRASSVCAMVIIFLAAAASAQEGTASGKLTVGGKTTPLSHAYAMARKDTFDPTKERVFVVLSDVAIPEESLWEDFPGMKMGEAGQLHAIEIEIMADKSVNSGGIIHSAFAETDGFIGTRPEFQAKTFDGKIVEGTFSSGKPEVFQNQKFEYAATFRAPIRHRAPPTATGAAAAQTAPGKLVMEFLKAARAGNKAVLKNLLTADYGKGLEGPHAKVALESWKMNAGDPGKRQIGTLHVTGSSADVVMVDQPGGDMVAKFTLVLVAGQWKIDSVMM